MVYPMAYYREVYQGGYPHPVLPPQMPLSDLPDTPFLASWTPLSDLPYTLFFGLPDTLSDLLDSVPMSCACRQTASPADANVILTGHKRPFSVKKGITYRCACGPGASPAHANVVFWVRNGSFWARKSDYLPPCVQRVVRCLAGTR